MGIRNSHMSDTRRLAPVVQMLDSAIHRINHYAADKYQGNQLRYPLDSAIQRLNNRGQMCNVRRLMFVA